MVDAAQADMAMGRAILPDRFGPGLLGGVIRIPGNYAAVLPYRTDGRALQALLPRGMLIAGEPMVYFRFPRAEGIDWAVMPYRWVERVAPVGPVPPLDRNLGR